MSQIDMENTLTMDHQRSTIILGLPVWKQKRDQLLSHFNKWESIFIKKIREKDKITLSKVAKKHKDCSDELQLHLEEGVRLTEHSQIEESLWMDIQFQLDDVKQRASYIQNQLELNSENTQSDLQPERHSYSPIDSLSSELSEISPRQPIQLRGLAHLDSLPTQNDNVNSDARAVPLSNFQSNDQSEQQNSQFYAYVEPDPETAQQLNCAPQVPSPSIIAGSCKEFPAVASLPNHSVQHCSLLTLDQTGCTRINTPGPESKPEQEESASNKQHYSRKQQPDTYQDSVTNLTTLLQRQLNLPKVDLVTFNGDPLQYHRFKTAFEEDIVKSLPNNYSQQLNFLGHMCVGQAHKAIEPYLFIRPAKQALQEALIKLHKIYGREDKIVDAYIDPLLHGPILKPEPHSLREFASRMENCLVVLKSLNYHHLLNSRDYIAKIMLRLPHFLQIDFHNKHGRSVHQGKTVSFINMIDFLYYHADMAEDFMGRAIADNKSKGRIANTKPKHHSVFTTQEKPRDQVRNTALYTPHSRPACTLCQKNHYLWGCEQFRSKPAMQRWEIINQINKTECKANKICFNCLGNGHRSDQCNLKGRCKICHSPHHTLLHVQKSTDKTTIQHSANESSFPQKKTEIAANVTATTSRATSKSKTRLKVVPIKAWGTSENNQVSTYAFLDEGSEMTFCTKRLMDKLGLNGPEVKRTLSGINCSATQTGHRVSLSVQGIYEKRAYYLNNIMAIPNLPNLKDSIPTNADVHRYDHLQGLSFPEMDYQEIDLLIGADMSEALKITNIRTGGPNEPQAIHTRLGWALFGTDKFQKGQHDMRINAVHEDNSNLHQKMLTMFDRDFLDEDKTDDLALSIEDQRALTTMRSTIKKRNGHYTLGLPWKRNDITLPYNRCMATKRLHHLKKKLQGDAELLCKYKEKMDESLEMGYARKVPPEDNSGICDRTWYIPHHCTGKKFRIVFDCAATFNGTSLNDALLQGPDLTNSLVGVLLRFRQEPIAFIADIKSMFYQVHVKPTDWNALRFLWWPAGDLSKPPEDYQMLVHLFGATSSPSCASFALQKVAEDNEIGASETTLSTIRRSFYVDDCLKSVQTKDEAVQLIKELTALLKCGGFHLTKFVSNKREVLQHIPLKEQAPSLKDLDLNCVLPVDKALGVYWNTETDNFEIKVQIQMKPPTRRGILSMVSQIYDPMGFVQPFVLPIKKVLQKTCIDGLGWDETVSTALRQTWTKWLNDLPNLEQVTIPRCFKSGTTKFKPQYELHCFSDASESGCGAVCYLRYRENDTWNSIFVMGKSRVSPSKPVTIPRLELTAAVTSVKLKGIVTKELECNISRVIFWTDSTSVIHYINNEAKRFKTYVANRIAFIRQNSEPSQWRHVGTKINPADIASRGLMPKQLKEAKLWFNGPEFLKQEETYWPKRPDVLPGSSETLSELKKETAKLVQTVQESTDSLTQLIHFHSSFTRLQRSAAWINRYKTYLINKYLRRQQVTPEPFLSPEEVNCAKLDIIRLVQRHSFATAMKELPEHAGMDETCTYKDTMTSPAYKGTQLAKLKPFKLDGILRVGGRLQRSPLPFDSKHQILLPHDHHLTDIIIHNYHQREGHSGTLHVLAATREQYWIIKGHSAVKRAIKDCTVCRKWNSKIGEQIMAPLPVDRVTPGQHPFTSVGVDYMGPLFVKIGRSQVKRFGCIFTCMATRAVHIEVAHSLDTSSFLHAFRRFMNRRGRPKVIRSDNGTNFVGAERELREGLQRLNKDQISNSMMNEEIKWYFNPPAASHQGGIWERIIRSVRKILRYLTCERTLTDEQLSTFMTEVERILNDRPLTPVSTNPQDLKALTPSSILLGRLETSLSPDQFIKADGYKKSWKLVQWLADQFWYRWTKEYLPLLQSRQKWLQPTKNFAPGALVLIANETSRRGSWPMGIIEKTFPDRDGIVRRVRVRTTNATYDRDIRKICLLEEA